MLPGATLNLLLSRGNVAYSSQSQRLHSVEWARAASGSWSRKVADRASPTCVAGGGVCCGCDKAVGSWNIVFQDPTVSVLWRCPTLPHPPRCSTIGACGLSFQVRNGGWAFPRGYDHHKMSQPVFTLSPVVVLGVVLVVIRIVATSTLSCLSTIRCIRLWLKCLLVSAH